MAALFDDGIVEIYNMTNTAENGLKPNRHWPNMTNLHLATRTLE